MAKKNNMSVWDSVCKTDPQYTKQVGFGRKFTTINAMSQVMTATEKFGAYGEGWGVRDESFYMVTEGLLGYQATFFWNNGDVTNTFAINSSINTHNKSGKLDDEVFKKVSTDALTKGLSKLGFNADVFLGLWDDNRYVEKVKDEFKKEQPKPKLSDAQFTAMCKFIEDGKANVVKKKLNNYTLTKKQKDWFDKALLIAEKL